MVWGFDTSRVTGTRFMYGTSHVSIGDHGMLYG